jgi:hypothetical protein
VMPCLCENRDAQGRNQGIHSAFIHAQSPHEGQ